MATDKEMQDGIDKEDGREPDNEMQSFIDGLLDGISEEVSPEVASGDGESEEEKVVEPAPEAKAAESKEEEASSDDQQKPEKEREEESEEEPTSKKEPELESKAEESEEPESAQEQLSAEQIRDRILGMRDALAKGYQLSQADADLIATEPQKVLPKLMANVQLQVLQQVAQMVGQALPQRITDVQAQITARKELESEFFTMWPTLKGIKNDELMSAVGVVRQTVGKDATKEDILGKVGRTIFALRGEDAPKVGVKKEEGKKTTTTTKKNKPHAPVQGKLPDPPKVVKDEQEAFFAEMAAASSRR